MPGGYGIPFRAPCNPGSPGTWPPAHTGSGGCYNHTKASAKHVPYFPNVTHVDDWRVNTDPLFQSAGIPPYPRKSDAGCPHDGSCGHDSCIDDAWPSGGDCPGPCGSPCNPEAIGQQLCDSWFTGSSVGGPPQHWRTCPGGSSEAYFNCYQQNGTKDLSVCRKIGFKNVQAKKAWHGSFGWASHERGICWFPGVHPGFPAATDTCAGHTDPNPCTANCGACLWEPEHPTPDTTKYLTWNLIANAVNTQNGVQTSFATINRTVTVDRYTGWNHLTNCSDSSSDPGTLANLKTSLSGSTSVGACGFYGLADTLLPFLAYSTNDLLAYARAAAILFVTSGTACSQTSGCEPQYTCKTYDIPSGNLIVEMDVDGIAGTFNYRSWDITGFLQCQIQMQIGNTQTKFSIDTFSNGPPQTAHLDATNTLSNAYDTNGLYADVKTLLNQWDLSNDIVYPWRTDGYISIGPTVAYDENVPTQPSLAGFLDCPVGPAPTNPFTGVILGVPLPAGYGPHFDWNHRTWRGCRSGGPNDPAIYVYAHGAWANNPPPSPIPPYTFTSGVVPVVSWTTSGSIVNFSTSSQIPGFTAGVTPVAVCGTGQIDQVYSLNGPTGTGPYQYSMIARLGDAPFDSWDHPPKCTSPVAGVVTQNSDATFYTAGDVTDLFMPPTATLWTENDDKGPLPAGNMPPGAWLINTFGYLFAQKWAEVKVHRPSYDFARPCGLDKWLLDETKVTCVESSDGGTPPILKTFADVGINDNDICYVCGVRGPPAVTDGVYKVHKIDGTHFKILVDMNMYSVTTAVQSGGSVNITVSKPMLTLQNGNTVDLASVPGLGTGLTVTVTDSTHFSVPGTLSSAYSSGGFVSFSGSGAYQNAPNSIDFDCTTGIIGKIRFPTTPGICGRLGIAAASQSGSKVNITTSATHYLANGELVDLTGVSGLGTSLSVQVTSALSFQVTGTLTLPYVSGGFVNVHGAAPYQWYDDQSKGDFLYASYNFNFRDYIQADLACEQYHGGSYSVCGTAMTGCNQCAATAPAHTCVNIGGSWESDVRQTQSSNGLDRAITGFTITQPCLPFDPCNPQVLAIIPSGGPESFHSPDLVENFPSTFTSDDRYGAQWQAFFLQSVTDLLWQQPHKPCVEGISDFHPTHCVQSEDDGSCEADTCVEIGDTGAGTVFYAHRPEVEAMQTIPAGAPIPQVGHIGFPTYSQLSSGPIDPTWPRLLPPLGPGYGTNAGEGGVDPMLPVLLEMPWTLFFKEANCVCQNGRFSAQYQTNGIQIHCP